MDCIQMPQEGQISNCSVVDSPATSCAHFIGVCGAGMKALAELLHGMGWALSGSDLSPASPAIIDLIARGMTFHQGHNLAHLPANVRCVIYSPAVRAENPERAEATRRGLPQWSYSQMVGRLMSSRRGICVAGTHGKSTTTALIGWILTEAGRDPSVLVGAESRDTGRSGRAGSSDLIVVESCEFNQSFLDFQPSHAVITNVEPDHFDCYADLPSLIRSFAQFAERVPANGILLANGDCATTQEAVRNTASKAISFGYAPESDWQAKHIVHAVKGTQFELLHHGRHWANIALQLHGEHNVQNAMAAAALSAELGIDARTVESALASFAGIKRRFEVVASRRGLTLIDDYAHHPTAVRACLKTARQVYADSRIWVAFQPHQVSRTRALMADFASSFDDADEVMIAPIFAARERVTDEPVECARELARRIADRGRSCRFVPSLDLILPTVDDAARPGDVLIAMGAGDIDRIHHEFT